MSNALSEQIAEKIEAAGGWIPFGEFMREALYAPGQGYYESAEVFGGEGDFVTGADIGPWLALGFADLIEWSWRQLGSPAEWVLVEQGGGEGKLLCKVLTLLGAREMPMPVRVHAVEQSVHMRERQRTAYEQLGVAVQQHAQLGELEAADDVVYFCNELPDAFPVRCFTWRGGRMFERGVGLAADGGFSWCEGAVLEGNDAPTIDAQVMQEWPEGYVSEWNPQLAAWQQQVAGIMRRGLVCCVDYGFAQSEYYRPQRTLGTLLGHLNHQPVTEVLNDPGSRDITAHIDFTALQRIGRTVGLEMGCWMTQGAWLAQSPGVQAVIRELAAQDTPEAIALMTQAKRMLMPQGMGELFKLAVQSRGVAASCPDFLPAFNRIDALERKHA